MKLLGQSAEALYRNAKKGGVLFHMSSSKPTVALRSETCDGWLWRHTGAHLNPRALTILQFSQWERVRAVAKIISCAETRILSRHKVNKHTESLTAIQYTREQTYWEFDIGTEYPHAFLLRWSQCWSNPAVRCQQMLAWCWVTLHGQLEETPPTHLELPNKRLLRPLWRTAHRVREDRHYSEIKTIKKKHK